jgi:hypothetical protein
METTPPTRAFHQKNSTQKAMEEEESDQVVRASRIDHTKCKKKTTKKIMKKRK